MADTPQHDISPGQLMVYILSAQLGLGVFGITRHAVERLGHAGWWLVLAMGFLSLAGVWIINALCQRFNSSIIGINRRVLGNLPGTILNYLLVATLFAATILQLAFFLQIMKIFFFRTTPFLVLAIFLIIPLIYLVAKGLKTVARFDSFVYIAALTLSVMMLAGWNRAEWSFLQPWLAFKTTAFLPTVYRLAFSFIGFELLLFVYPRVRSGHLRAGLGAATFTTLVLTAFTVFTIAYFGEEYIIKQVFSLLTLVRSLEAPVVGRLDIYFLMIWLPAMSSASVAFFTATQLAAVEILPRLSYRLILGILTVLTVAALFPLTDFSIVLRILNVLGVVQFFGLGLFLPTVIWLTATLRGLGT